MGKRNYSSAVRYIILLALVTAAFEFAKFVYESSNLPEWANVVLALLLVFVIFTVGLFLMSGED